MSIILFLMTSVWNLWDHLVCETWGSFADLGVLRENKEGGGRGGGDKTTGVPAEHGPPSRSPWAPHLWLLSVLTIQSPEGQHSKPQPTILHFWFLSSEEIRRSQGLSVCFTSKATAGSWQAGCQCYKQTINHSAISWTRSSQRAWTSSRALI